MTANRPSRATDGDPFEALGDPNRRAIVELLGARGAGPSASSRTRCRSAGRPSPATSGCLKSAGLVVEEPRGTRRIYRLHDEGPEAVRAYLERVWGDAASRYRLVADNAKPRRASGRGTS